MVAIGRVRLILPAGRPELLYWLLPNLLVLSDTAAFPELTSYSRQILYSDRHFLTSFTQI